MLLIRVIATADRLGFGRILSSQNRIQCSRRITLLQGPRVACRLPRIRLQSGHVELWLHVRVDGEIPCFSFSSVHASTIHEI